MKEWQWNEFQQVGTDYTNVAEVAAYDQRMREMRDVDGENRYIESQLALPQTGAKVLEIGTGTGAFARYIATKAEKVYAADVSKIMLDYAKQQAVKANLTNIEFLHAGFLSFNLPDASVNAVVSGLALHHLPDAWKMMALERIAAVLKPGGRLQLLDVAFDWQPGQSTEYFERICHSCPQSQTAMFRHVAQEYSTMRWLLDAMLTHAGFKIIKSEVKLDFLYLITAEKV